MSKQPYSIHTDVKFPPLQLIDVRKLQQGFTVPKGVLHRTRAPVRSVVPDDRE
jgi:hypothetical protein